MLSTDSNTDATWPSLALEAWSDTYTTRVWPGGGAIAEQHA